LKFIHCSDLHLDSKIETLPNEKSKIRRDEIVRTFERLAEFAVLENVTAVIISGDMFDTRRVTLKTRGRVLQAIKKSSNIDFLYLSGNHDDDNFISETEDLPQNLKVFGDDWTTFSYGEVLVSGVKFTTANSLSIYDTLSLPEQKYNIVAMHGQIAGYKNTEQAEIISLPKLKDKNIDYLALGHIHAFAGGKLDDRGRYAYCGCLDGRGFDETGSKGFVLIEVEDKKADFKFVEFSSRNLYEDQFLLDTDKPWYENADKIISEVISKYGSDSLIKVVLTGERKPDYEIDVEGLTKRLNERLFFAKVYDKTTLKVDLSDYEHDKSVRGEFVRVVWESKLSDQEKSKIIACGLAALKGDEF
jgi:DNA repair exonuclease SbcCD nuclease subunit